MNASTVTTSTFTLAPQGGTAIAATVTYSSATNTATLTPSASLAYNTTYTATITTGATSSAGTALAANFPWSFTTAAAPAPTVTAVTPTNASTGVAVTSTVTATFSEAMSASTFTGSTFTLTPQGGSAVAATITYSSNGNLATLTPNAPLANNTTYTATVTTGVTSSRGAALGANYSWMFTTATAPPPTVTAVTPANGSTGVAITTNLTATFSTTMSTATINFGTFTLTGPGNSAVQGIVTPGATTSTFTPSANLAYNTTHTATITTGVTSSAGIALAQNYTWSFTTEAAPIPTVTTTVPANGATGVNVSDALTATFSQPMNANTITASTFTLTGPGSTSVSGLVTFNTGTSTATFTPNSALAYSSSYTATITTGATSSAGAALASNYVWSFTTGASPNVVTVNFGTTYQTIRGFGGASVWLGRMPTAVSTALFSPINGLGLSILRVRIDPTGSPTSTPPFVTTGNSGWTDEVFNAKAAVQNNPSAIVFASPWTPPPAPNGSSTPWKLNGSSTTIQGVTFNEAYNTGCGSGSENGAYYCGGYVDPNHYADYAAYLEDFVTYFNSNAGFNLYAISMQNEPEVNQTYESCVWTPTQMDAFVSGYGNVIANDPYSTKLMMPESEDFYPWVGAPTLSDSSAQGYVSIIGGHIYQTLFGGSITAYPALPSGDSPKELWMSEFGPLSATAPSWSTALTTYAEDMHNAMVTGQYNAYVWWGLFGQSAGSCGTAAGTCGLVDLSGNLTVTGEVMGQYSKFLMPGGNSVRVSATATPVLGVFVSAYENTGNLSSYPYKYVIVAINTNTTTENLSFTLSGDSGAVTSMTPYQSTSATSGIVAQPAVSVSSEQFSYTLPAQSIVTFVQ